MTNTAENIEGKSSSSKSCPSSLIKKQKHNGHIMETLFNKTNKEPTSDEVAEMKNEIMRLMHKLGGDITYADLTSYIEGFRDESWMAETGYRKETIRAEQNWDVDISKSSVIIWEGHSKLGGEALLQLIHEGKVKYGICSSKRYRHYKLKYPIIRRVSDAIRSYDKPHWVPIKLLLPEDVKNNLNTIYPAENQVIGNIQVDFYFDKNYPVRVTKEGVTSSYDSACEYGVLYDESNNECDLTEFEHKYLLTMKSEVSSWEDQFED